MIFTNSFLIVLGQQRKESRNEKVSTDLCYGLTADNGTINAILRESSSYNNISNNKNNNLSVCALEA